MTVIDKASDIATMTSYANGAQLSYTHASPLANTTLLTKLPSILLGSDSSIEISPSINRDFLSWGLAFLANCNSRQEAYHFENILRIGLYSRAVLHQSLSELELDFHYRRNGKLILYNDPRIFARAIKNIELSQSLGSTQRALNISQCIDLDASLNHLEKAIVGGIYSDIDECGDSYKFCQQLAKYIQAKGSVQFILNCQAECLENRNGTVTSVNTNKGNFKADKIVIAMGVDSRKLCRTINFNIPLYPIKGYSITVPAKKAPNLSITDMQNKTVYCRLGNKLRIAGMNQICGYEHIIQLKKINKLLANATKTFPDAGDYSKVLHQWSGLRAVTPDSAPILGKTPFSNLYLNLGQGMLGWTLASGSSELVADIMTDKQPEISMQGLTYERFC